jgi:hypothetical protein
LKFVSSNLKRLFNGLEQLTTGGKISKSPETKAIETISESPSDFASPPKAKPMPENHSGISSKDQGKLIKSHMKTDLKS